VKTGEQSFILKQLDRAGFDLKNLYNFRTHSGVALSLEEQQILAKDTHDVGKLPTLLEDYFNSNDYKWSMNYIKQARNRGDADSLLAADVELKKVHSQISAAFSAAKDVAGRDGRLKDQPNYQAKQGRLLNPQVGSSLNPEVEAIIELPYR